MPQHQTCSRTGTLVVNRGDIMQLRTHSHRVRCISYGCYTDIGNRINGYVNTGSIRLEIGCLYKIGGVP